MTNAGDRVLCRETTVKHKETGVAVTVSNRDIPSDQRQPSHMEQRGKSIKLLSEKLGAEVLPSECLFEFVIV